MSGFRIFLDALTPVILLQTVCLNAKHDIPPYSTSLHPDYVLETVTLAELKQHTFTGSPCYSVARKQCRRRMTHQGFLLFSNKNPVRKTVTEEDRDEWVSIFHDKLPKLLRSDPYRRQFSNIFARVQGIEGNTKHRFRDSLRLQLKLRRELKIVND